MAFVATSLLMLALYVTAFKENSATAFLTHQTFNSHLANDKIGLKISESFRVQNNIGLGSGLLGGQLEMC